MNKTKTKNRGKEQNNAQNKRLAELSSTKKTVFWFIVLVLPILFPVALEFLLMALGYGENLHLTKPIVEDGKAWLEINKNVGQRYFGLNPEFARQAEESRFAQNKPENGIRIFCLGGSTMAGFPYNKNATMPGILYTYLKNLYPDMQVEVINLGIAAVNSYAIRDLMFDVVKLNPDALLVYTGHNEFYGALGVGSGFQFSANRYLTNTYLALLRYRSFYLVQQMIRSISNLIWPKRKNLASAMPVMERMAKQQVISFGSELFKNAETIFRENLVDVINTGRIANVPIIMGNLVSNLKDHHPFVSNNAGKFSQEEKLLWQKSFVQGVRFYKNGTYQPAYKSLHEAFEIDSTNAELCYYLGKTAFASGNLKQAERFFSLSRDFDLLRFRAPGSFNKIIRDLCSAFSIPFADIQSAFKNKCDGNIVGSELIAEHLHPNIKGYALMAKEFLRQLVSSQVLPGNLSPDQIDKLSENPAQLGITTLD